MKHKKLSAGILSLVLTVAMVGTMMPSTVFATEGSTAHGTSGIECHGEYDKVVELFTALPKSSELTVENRDIFIAQLTEAMAAFEALIAEEQTLFKKDHTDLYKGAMALNDAITGEIPAPMAPDDAITREIPAPMALNDAITGETPTPMVGKIDSGTVGGCDWVVGTDGVLTISPTIGESGVLPGSNYAPGPWGSSSASITSVVVKTGVSTASDAMFLFYDLQNCTTMDLSNLDTSNTTDMTAMFTSCYALKSLDVSNFNTTKVTSMKNMFRDCRALTSLNISQFNTANVTSMGEMFYGCWALTSLNVDSFNTANVKDMSYMFSQCRALTSLNVSHFNTNKVTAMNFMFNECKALTSLNVTNFNTALVTNMGEMFYKSGVKSLDLSSFNTAKVTNISGMLDEVHNIESIKFGAKFNKAVRLYKLTKAGYVFGGWYTNPECTGTAVIGADGAEYTNSAETTVYTKWTSLNPTITVGAQINTATYGATAAPTFAITNINFGGTFPGFAPEVEWIGTAPAGVTPVFISSNAMLAVNTTATTPAGQYRFKVVSPKATPGTGNYESGEATLIVNKLEASIKWDTTTSFTYSGSPQAPTATVRNRVGTDAVTVDVTGGKTNVGNYTAIASNLTGTAKSNYELPTIGNTQAFNITEKDVTVNDGTLKVKKEFDNSTSPGVATGKLGLTGAVDSDDVSVKVEQVGNYADNKVGKNKIVTLTVSLDGTTNSNYTLGGNTSYTFTTAEITKVAYNGGAVSAPNSTPDSKEDKKIILAAVTSPVGEAVQYAKSKTNTPPTSDGDWQTSTTFDNLDPNTEYFFFARVQENDNHAAGGVSSPGTSITTNKSNYTTKASAPDNQPQSKTDTNITLKPVTTPVGENFEYAISTTSTPPAVDSSDWKDSPAFTGLNSNKEYYFFARVKENSIHKVGPASDGTKIKTDLSDADKMAAAKAKVEAALKNIIGTNLTTAEEIMKAVDNAIAKSGVSAAWKTGSEFNKVLATDKATGSITGTITLTLNGKTVEVAVDKSIGRFIQQELTSTGETDKVKVGGKISEHGKLHVELITAKDGYKDFMVKVDTAKDEIIGAYEAKIIGGTYEGKLTITFAIGEKYNGKTITIHHKKADGTIET
ncbi:MAG: BspA family leucine-rich repeat surface protein, partial [Lachnospiraceae bacterium]